MHSWLGNRTPALQTCWGSLKEVSKQVAKGGLADTGHVDLQKASKETLVASLKDRNKVGVNDQFLGRREVTTEVQ